MKRFWQRLKQKVDLGFLAALVISLTVALLIGTVILAVTGYDTGKALGALLRGSFSSKQYFGNMLEYAMVLCRCGLACDVGSRAGIFNVGGEGQLILGAGLSEISARCFWQQDYDYNMSFSGVLASQ